MAKNTTIRGLLVNVDKNTIDEATIEKSLEGYYKALNCDMIEIPTRTIGGKSYAIVCDEEGLMKEFPKISAIDNNGNPALVGNLFIVKNCGSGGMRSLTDEELAELKTHIAFVRTVNYPTGYPLICDLDG